MFAICHWEVSTYSFLKLAIALLLYDWILTVGREKQYIWRSPISSSSILYLIIRYSSLAAAALTVKIDVRFSGIPSRVRIRTLPVVCIGTRVLILIP